MRRETECFVVLHFAPAGISPQLQRYKLESKEISDLDLTRKYPASPIFDRRLKLDQFQPSKSQKSGETLKAALLEIMQTSS